MKLAIVEPKRGADNCSGHSSVILLSARVPFVSRAATGLSPILHHGAWPFIAKGERRAILRIFVSSRVAIVVSKSNEKLSSPYATSRIDSDDHSIRRSNLTLFILGIILMERANSSHSSFPRSKIGSEIKLAIITYHLEIFLLNLRKESLSKVLDSQLFNDSMIGVGRSRPMTRAIGHGSKVWPKRCDECHCTRPVLHRGSTCGAKRREKRAEEERRGCSRA